MIRWDVVGAQEICSPSGLRGLTDPGGGALEYEILDHTHLHLICIRCVSAIEMDDDLVEPMREAIRARYGFAPQVDHLALFGFCVECQHVPPTNDGADDVE